MGDYEISYLHMENRKNTSVYNYLFLNKDQ